MAKYQYENVKEITGVGLHQNDKGEVKPYVRMMIDFASGPKEMTWFGNLKGSTPEKTAKAVEGTIKTLVEAGFAGDDFEDLTRADVLDVFWNKKELTVSLEDYQGKLQVRYINEKKAKKEFTGTAPKFADVFAKTKKDMGIEAMPF